MSKEENQKYYFLRRAGLFIAALVIISQMWTNIGLLHNQVFADASLIVILVACFALRLPRKAR